MQAQYNYTTPSCDIKTFPAVLIQSCGAEEWPGYFLQYIMKPPLSCLISNVITLFRKPLHKNEILTSLRSLSNQLINYLSQHLSDESIIINKRWWEQKVEVRVPVCFSEVAHGVGSVSQAWMDPCVALLAITRAARHLFLLPSLKAGCFGVQIPLCRFRETDRD